MTSVKTAIKEASVHSDMDMFAIQLSSHISFIYIPLYTIDLFLKG